LHTKDTYKTIIKPSEEVLFKDKNSKFYGYAFPVSTENDIREILSDIKHKHQKARHFCYAYQLGHENILFRTNDDGEPNNSAGIPIYGQIQSFGVTNVLIVVVRYFGGTKLGVSGLINAYKTSSQMVLLASKIIEKTIDISYAISFGYENMNNIMRIIKEHNLNVINQKMDLNCEITISVRKNDARQIFELFDYLFKVNINKMSD